LEAAKPWKNPEKAKHGLLGQGFTTVMRDIGPEFIGPKGLDLLRIGKG